MEQSKRRLILRDAILLFAFYIVSALAVKAVFGTNEVLRFHWLALGPAIYCLVVHGYRVIVVTAIATLTGNLIIGADLDASLWHSARSVIIVSAGGRIYRNTAKNPLSFEEVKDFARLFGTAIALALVSTAVASLQYKANLPVLEVKSWLQRVAGFSFGFVISMAVVLVIANWGAFKNVVSQRLLEGALILGVAALFGQVVFLDAMNDSLGQVARGYWMFLFVTMAGLRLGMVGTTLVLLIISVQALVGAILGLGFFADDIAQTGLANYYFYMLSLASDGYLVAVLFNQGERRLSKLDLSRHEAVTASAQLSGLVASTSDAVYLKDNAGRYQLANRAFALLTGRSIDEILGRDDLRIFEPQDAALIIKNDKDVMEGGGPVSIEEVFTTASGDRRVFLATKGPLFDEKGVPLGLFGIARDITDRKVIKQKLLESEQRYRSAFETSIDAVNINRLSDGLYLEVNQGFLDIMGYDREEVIGHTSLELNIWVNPDDRSRLAETLQRDGKYSNLEAQFRRKDGVIIWGLMSASVMELQGTSCILSISRDITERKHTELELLRHRYHLEELVAERTAQLSDSVEKFRALATLAPVGIYLTDPFGKCQYTNPRWCEMAGLQPEQAIGDGWLEGIHPDDRDYVFANWQKMVDSLGRWGMEYRFKTPEGEISWVYGLAVPTFDDHHTVTGYIGVNLDITERKLAEDELKQAKAAAEAANIAKSAFVANMSHEIRTPINAITGMARIISRAGLTEMQSGQMDKLLAASNHLLDIINDILDLSKIEAGKMVVEDVPVNVGELVGGLHAMLQERLSAKNLHLNIELGTLPVGLSGDATRLRQALLNYLTNAIKFTAHGVITLRVRCESQSDTQTVLRFEVQDTGIGIEPAALERLFTAFEQADNTTTRKYGGTGLGLVITRRIAQLMGGDAGATSTQGVGSIFWFTAKLSVNVVQHSITAKSDTANSEAKLKHEYAGARVLLVEDEPINCEITEFLLADVGIRPDIASNGQVALDMAQEKDYDLILMDMQMPVMNGLEATLHIRQLNKGTRVPIIAMTANAFEDDRQLCLSVGMDDFLAKPIDPEGLFAMMLKWLSHPQTVAGSAPTLLQWDDSFSVGDAEMDGQHQVLFDMCNRLAEINRVSGEQAKEQFAELLQGFVQYAQIHFSAEEVLLRRIHYPYLAEQEAAHLGYVQEVNHLIDEAMAVHAAMPETYKFLMRWLTHHILVSDMKYRPYV